MQQMETPLSRDACFRLMDKGFFVFFQEERGGQAKLFSGKKQNEANGSDELMIRKGMNSR